MEFVRLCVKTEVDLMTGTFSLPRIVFHHNEANVFVLEAVHVALKGYLYTY